MDLLAWVVILLFISYISIISLQEHYKEKAENCMQLHKSNVPLLASEEKEEKWYKFLSKLSAFVRKILIASMILLILYRIVQNFIAV